MCDKCDKTVQIIREWLSKQGHDACWYYPSLFTAMAELHGIETKTYRLPPSRKEFRAGCRRFEDEIYSNLASPRPF